MKDSCWGLSFYKLLYPNNGDNRMLDSFIINDYNNGIGTNTLANKYQLHRTTIQRILKRNNVKLRKTSPHKSYNVHFFSTYTHESCYWAGFILADGYLRITRDMLSIKLAIIDIKHLEKFKKCINYTGEIHTNKEKTYAYIDICGKWFKNDLINNFSITPKKSFTTTFSDKIPREFYASFIRGIMDGDGCISYSKTKTKLGGKIYNQLSFLGTHSLLTSISNIISTEVSIEMKTENKLPKIHQMPGTYRIQYYYHNTNKILTWLYSTKSENTYLDRKFEKWLSLNK